MEYGYKQTNKPIIDLQEILSGLFTAYYIRTYIRLGFLRDLICTEGDSTPLDTPAAGERCAVSEDVLDKRTSHQPALPGSVVQASGVGERVSGNPGNALWELVLCGDALP